MEGTKRISLNREVLHVLIEAEMSKHPQQCAGCKGWRVEAIDPDESGCNWKFTAGAADISTGCVERIAPYLSVLRENFSLQDRWYG